MAEVEDVCEGVRIHWASMVRNVQQAAVGDLGLGVVSEIAVAVRRLKREIPHPVNQAESLNLRQSLIVFADRAARDHHQRFHARFDSSACAAAPPLVHEAVWLDPHQAIEQLLDAWMADYVDWFHQRHSLPAVGRAIHILQERFAEAFTIGELARASGCSSTTLRNQFDDALRLSPFQYLTRVRIREGLRRLRKSSDTIEEASRFGGYQSCNKFSRRVRRYTGLTPSDVRDLGDEAFDRLLEERMPLVAPRRVAQRTIQSPPLRSPGSARVARRVESRVRLRIGEG